MINTRRNRIGVRIVNFIARILLSKNYNELIKFIYIEGFNKYSKSAKPSDIKELQTTKWGL